MQTGGIWRPGALERRKIAGASWVVEGEVHGRREGGTELKGMRVNENERQGKNPGKVSFWESSPVVKTQF